MTYRSLLHGLAAVTSLTLAATGCSTHNAPTTPAVSSQQDADDAAQTVGIMVGKDNGVTLQQSAILPAAFSSRSEPLSMVEPRGGSGGAPQTVTIGGITWELTRLYYDSGNVVQGVYDPATTARIAAKARGRGDVRTVTAHSDSAAYHGQMSVDITGLLASSAALRLNGNRRDTLTTAFTSRFRDERVRLRTVAAGTIDGMTQGKQLDLHPWPADGTATWVLTLHRLPETASSTAVTKTAVIRYDGTPTPTLVVDQRYHYTIDLRSGDLVRLPS